MKKVFFYFILAIILFTPIFVLAPKLLAQDIGGLDKSSTLLNQAAGQAGYSTDSNLGLVDIIGDIIFYLLGLLGVLFMVLIVYGGVIWMTAGGNEQYIEKAQKIIKNAAGGLVIIILAGMITWFVVDVLFKASTPAPTTP